VHREQIAILQDRIRAANAQAKAEGREATQAEIEAIIAAWYEEFATPSEDGRAAAASHAAPDRGRWPGDWREGPHDVQRNPEAPEQLGTVDAYWDPGKSEWVAVVRGRAAEPIDEDRVLDGAEEPGLLRQAEEGVEEIRKSAEHSALANQIADQDVIAARAATEADIARASGEGATAEADRLEAELLPELREKVHEAVEADRLYRETYERPPAPEPAAVPSPVPGQIRDPRPDADVDPADGVGWQTPANLPDPEPLPAAPAPGEPSLPVEDEETAQNRFASRGRQLKELRRERKERRLNREESLRWQVFLFAGKLSLQMIGIIVLVEGVVQAFGLEPSISDTVDLPFSGMSIILAFGVGMLMQLAASAAGVLLARVARQQLAAIVLLLGMAAAIVRLVVHLDDVRGGGDKSLFLTDVSLLSLLSGAAIAFVITVGKTAIDLRETSEAAVRATTAYANRYGDWIKERAASAVAAYEALVARIDELRRIAGYAEMRALEAVARGIEGQQRKSALEALLDARYRAEAGAKELRVAQGVIAYLAARYWALREFVAHPASPMPYGVAPLPARVGRGWIVAAGAVAATGVGAAVLIPSLLAAAAGAGLGAIVLLVGLLRTLNARRAAALAGAAADDRPDHAVGLNDAPAYRFLPHDSRPRHRGEDTDNTDL
jgi:hypothetical protein